MLYKSFYVQTSWAQNMCYKAVSYFVDPVTKTKINMTSDKTHETLLEMYHPCQLEERFGGTAKTPTNFWPPYVGKEFIPEKFAEEEKANYMTDSDYERILKENPGLSPHPLFMTCSTRDFVFWGRPF